MKVTVYSTPTCPWCKKVKAFLKENKVKFKSINVAKDKKSADDMMKKTGQMGVPVIEVDGKIIVGFNESKLKKTLKL